MPSSNLSTEEFLDDMKQGWCVKYGPTLYALGLDDLDDAQDFSEFELEELLGAPLRAADAPPSHVARIVKRLYLINSEQGNTTNPNPFPHLTTIHLICEQEQNNHYIFRFYFVCLYIQHVYVYLYGLFRPPQLLDGAKEE
jgi:hypothetical protein